MVNRNFKEYNNNNLSRQKIKINIAEWNTHRHKQEQLEEIMVQNTFSVQFEREMCKVYIGT